MSLYHFSRSVVQRSTGGSASKALSYIHRTKIKDEFLGKTYSFPAEKNEVIQSSLYIPEKAPSFLKELEKEFKRDPSSAMETLGNLFDKVENDFIKNRYRTEEMRNAQMMRAQTSFMDVLALQKEFSLDENQFLVDQYITRVYTSRGLVATAAIHFEENNPHVHIMVGQRGVNDAGFLSKKERDVLSREGLKRCRHEWAEINNQLYRYKGMEHRVTAESFRSLGIELTPTIHEGDDRFRRYSEERVESNRSINESHLEENRAKLLAHPEGIIPVLSANRVSFTADHVVQALEKYFPEEPLLVSELTEKVLLSSELVPLSKDIHGKDSYTTKEYLASEDSLLDHAQHMLVRGNHRVTTEAVESQLSDKFSFLSEEQKTVVRESCESESLHLIVGRAGVGKSTLMEAVSELYTEKGYKVFGSAWAGAAAEELGGKIHGPSLTLKSWLHRWEEFDKKTYGNTSILKQGFTSSGSFKEQLKEQLDSRTVFILDEAGTVDVDHMNQLLVRARVAGAKVIALGDAEQTAPIGPGAAFHALCEAHSFSLVENVRRQKHEWMCQASVALSGQDIASALEAYDTHHSLHWSDGSTLHEQLVADYLSDRADRVVNSHSSSLADQVILASTNRDVNTLNERVHEALVEQGVITECREFTIHTTQGTQNQEIGVGETLLFLQNDHREDFVSTLSGEGEGVKNGTMGCVVGFEENAEGVNSLRVELGNGRQVSFNPKEYPHFTQGYAMTVHKSQGKTFDRSYVMINGSQTADMTYVALTRHQNSCQLYINQDKYPDLHTLIPQVSQINALNFIQRDRIYGEEDQTIQDTVFDALHQYRDLRLDRASHYQQARLEAESTGTAFSKQKSFAKAKEAEGELKTVSSTLLDHWPFVKNYSREFGVDRYSLEVLSGQREKIKTVAQQYALKEIERYKVCGHDIKAIMSHGRTRNNEQLLPSHPDYESYRTLKKEQAILAKRFIESPTLYRSLLAESHVSFKGVETHAQAAVYRTNSEDRLLSSIRSFDEWHTASKALYGKMIADIKSEGVPYINIQHALRDHPSSPLLQQARERSLELAHAVVFGNATKSTRVLRGPLQGDRFRDVTGRLLDEAQREVLTSLPSSLRAELCHHANQKQVQGLVLNYTKEQDPYERQALAKAIQEFQQDGRYQKLTASLLKEHDIHPAMIKVDRWQHPAGYSSPEHAQEIRSSVQDYFTLNREIALRLQERNKELKTREPLMGDFSIDDSQPSDKKVSLTDLVARRDAALYSVSEYPHVLEAMFSAREIRSVNYTLPQKVQDQLIHHENRQRVQQLVQGIKDNNTVEVEARPSTLTSADLKEKQYLAREIQDQFTSSVINPTVIRNLQKTLKQHHVSDTLLAIFSNRENLPSSSVSLLVQYETQKLDNQRLWKSMTQEVEKDLRAEKMQVQRARQDITALCIDKTWMQGELRSFKTVLTHLEKLYKKEGSLASETIVSVVQPFVKRSQDCAHVCSLIQKFVLMKIQKDKQIYSLKMKAVKGHSMFKSWADQKYQLNGVAYSIVQKLPKDALERLGYDLTELRNQAKKHDVVQSIKHFEKYQDDGARLKISLYASSSNHSVSQFTERYIKAKSFEPSEFNRKSPKTLGQTLPANKEYGRYERSDVLAQVTLSDAQTLIEHYTSFKTNVALSTSHKLVMSESGRGSRVSVNMKDDKVVAFDFKEGIGGDIIGFLSHYSGNSYGKLCQEIGERLSAPKTYAPLEKKVDKKEAHVSREDVLSAIRDKQVEKTEDIAKVKKSYGHTLSTEDTLAARYLLQRGITRPLAEDIKYNAYQNVGHNLMAFARDEEGHITAYQRTSLDEKTHYKSEQGLSKISRGCVTGASIRVQEDTQSLGIIFLAEGVETALSLREAGIQGDIRATLGKSNLRNVAMSCDPSQHIVLVADNDGPHWTEDKSLMKTYETLKANGSRVDVVFPPALPNKDKVDFNDLLLTEKGLKHIRDHVKNVVPEAVPHVSLVEDYQQRLATLRSLESLTKEHRIYTPRLSEIKESFAHEVNAMAFDIARHEKLISQIKDPELKNQIASHAKEHIEHTLQRNRGMEI